MDTEEEAGRGLNGETGTDTYISPCVKQTASRNMLYSTGSSARCSVMTQRGGREVGGREVQEGVDICILIVDSLCCTTETNATL